jgi:hypothetical protein
MASPSPANPLGYLVKRQYNERLHINRQLLRERLYSARNLYRKDLLAHYGCVNAIEFSNKGELLASGENVKHSIYVIIVYTSSTYLEDFCAMSVCLYCIILYNFNFLESYFCPCTLSLSSTGLDSGFVRRNDFEALIRNIVPDFFRRVIGLLHPILRHAISRFC